MAVRRTARASGAGTLGTIAAILAFGMLGLALRVVPSVVTGDMLALAAPPRDDVTPAASTSPAPTTASRTATATPSARATATPSPRPTPKPTPKETVVPDTGPGTYRYAGLDVPPPSESGRLIRYDVRVESNLDVDPDEAARIISGVLNDERSWRGSGRVRFQLVSDRERAELHAHIVTPGTTDRLCAPLLTRGEVSCQNGSRVVLNAKRWQLGVSAYGDDLTGYRRYLVNHEFGHYIGYGHVQCPGRGRPAPVMMQQTKGLDGCRKNPWVESG